MKDIIKINDKEYKIVSNAFTPIEYKNHFQRKMIEDVNKVILASAKILGDIGELKKYIETIGITENQTENQVKNKVEERLTTWSDLTENIIPITWILIDENQRPSFKEFAESIDEIKIGDSWLTSVISMLASSILFPRI